MLRSTGGGGQVQFGEEAICSHATQLKVRQTAHPLEVALGDFDGAFGTIADVRVGFRKVS
jgi:hypothetical protein